MQDFTTPYLRNVCIIGHGHSGKTSLIEALLFNAKITNRLGRVDNGSSILDNDPEEIKRKITINTKVMPIIWQNNKVNILDTPGYADFVGEAKAAVRVCDSAILMVCGIAGVEVQTKKVWKFTEEEHLPSGIFINKLDKENSDFFRVLENIKSSLTIHTVPVFLPIGREKSFKGIVDLISGKAFGFTSAEGFAGAGENIEKEIEAPQEMLDSINKYRTELIEAVAETDEALLEKYLSEGSLSSEELIAALKKAILNREIIPVFCGAVYGGYGTGLLLNSLLQLFPSPDQRNGQTAKKASSNEQVIRKCSDNEPFSAIVFKNISEAKAGEFIYFKAFSGVVSQGVDVYNVNHSQSERMGQIIIFQGKERFEVPRLHAGDIGATTKLRRTLVGDTLCDTKDQIMLTPINFPLPVVSMALKPKSQKDQEKLSAGLMKFAEIDPTFKVAIDHEFGETVISAMGELHIDVIVERIKSRYGVEFDLDKPKVPYRETIKAKSEVQGKYKKQSGGRGQYGDVWLKLEPLPRGKGYEFVDEIVGGVIPAKYIPAVEKGVKESMNRGVLAGYPCVDMKVSLFDGTYHTVDSSDIAFQIAGSMAFRKAMEEAKPVLLEPIMTIEVTVPSEYMGEINGDLNSRHGRVLGMEAESKDLQKVKAQVPLAQLHRYSTDLRSMTQGKGYHTMEFSHYEEVPAFLTEKIIAEAKKAKEEKEQKS